ncbi:MAG: hypothetical protein E7178_02800 [Erysipelotrichaceae bacterium]|jgi:uncharacterized alkaline shock family protein YloU|nr:hypothetical protein [Erysipelotrichaceae bacterium]
MPEYMTIDWNPKGKLALSEEIVYHLVDQSLKNFKGMASGEELQKGEFARVINKTTITQNKNGIMDVKVYVAVSKSKNIQRAANEISKHVSSDLTLSLGHMPINVRVKVEDLF